MLGWEKEQNFVISNDMSTYMLQNPFTSIIPEEALKICETARAGNLIPFCK
jgi:hypothetical protein